MSWSDLAKVFSGFLIAIAIVIGGGFFAAQHLIAQFTAPPPKPTFPNDQPSAPIKPLPTVPPAQPAAVKPTPQPSPSPSAKPSPKPSEVAGYPARITQSQGLNVRQSPGRDAARVGGVDYNQRVVVLEDSPDKEWQRVRIEGSDVEGWIKSGYTERVDSAR
jgi:uncharacterized protein YgiM (DUF1202 family)